MREKLLGACFAKAWPVGRKLPITVWVGLFPKAEPVFQLPVLPADWREASFSGAVPLVHGEIVLDTQHLNVDRAICPFPPRSSSISASISYRQWSLAPTPAICQNLPR